MTLDAGSAHIADVDVGGEAAPESKSSAYRRSTGQTSTVRRTIRKPGVKSKLQVALSPETIRLMENEAAAQGLTMNEFMANAFAGVLAKHEEAKNIEVSKVSAIKTTRVFAASPVYDAEGKVDSSAEPPKAAFTIKVVGTPEAAKELTPFFHPHALEAKARDENNNEIPIYDATALGSSPWRVGTAQVSPMPEGTSCQILEDGTVRVHIPNIAPVHYGSSILETVGERKVEGTVITRDEQQRTSFDLQERKIVTDENGELLLITKEILRHTEEMHKVAARSAESAAEAVKSAAEAVKASSNVRRSWFGIDIKELSLKNIGNFRSNNEAEPDKPEKSFLEKSKVAIGDAASKGLGYLAKASVAVGLFTVLVGGAHMVMPDTVQSPTVVASKLMDVGKGVFLKTANEGSAEFTISKEGPVFKISTEKGDAKDEKKTDAKADVGNNTAKLASLAAIASSEADIKASFLKAVSEFKAGDKVSEIRLKSMYSAVSDINAAHALDGHKPLVDAKTMTEIHELLTPAVTTGSTMSMH